MRTVNRHEIGGYVGGNPQVFPTKAGGKVVRLRVATEHVTGRAPDSDKPEFHTEWHTVKCFGKIAEQAEADVRKGDWILVSGPVETRQWQDDEGNKREERSTIARDLQTPMRRKPKGGGDDGDEGKGRSEAAPLGDDPGPVGEDGEPLF